MKQSDKTNLTWPVKQRWAWITNEEQVQVFQAELLFQPSLPFLRAETATAQSKGGKVRLAMNRLQENLIFTGAAGEEEDVVVRIVPPAALIDTRDCGKNDLVLKKNAGLPTAFFLGVFCRNIQGKITVDISAPADFEWGATSQIENKGKGESWRSFELGNIQAANGAVLKFTLSKDDKKYSFALVSQKKEGQKEVDKRDKSAKPVFSGGLASYSLSVGTPSNTFNGSSLGFYVDVWSAPVWKSLRFGADYEYAQPTAEGAAAIDFNQFHLSSSWRSVFQSGFVLDPRVFLTSVTSSQGSGIALKHSNLGLGLFGGYQKGSSLFELGMEMSQFGAKSVTSATALSLAYTYRMSSFGWQIKYDTQTFGTTTEAGKQVKFGQNYIGLGLVF